MTGDMWALVLLCSAGSALAAFGGVVLLGRATSRAARIGDTDATGRTAFTFEMGRLTQATPSAREYLDLLGVDQSSGHRMIDHLAKSFPGLRAALLRVTPGGREVIASFDRARSAIVEAKGSAISLRIDTAETDIVTMDRGAHGSLRAELRTLRAMGDQMPFPVWRQTEDGIVCWANRAYLDLANRTRDADTPTWPPSILFPELAVGATTKDPQRVWIDTGDGDRACFECTIRRVEDDAFITAINADALIRAERTLDDFTQTFARTFADLAVGIAVFGRDRELIMFNPALTDLTDLPVDLLLGHPKLETFLDALRARRSMPECKDHTSWRQRVAEVEDSAREGVFAELWHLNGNRTYRVSGRPQLNGAFALLIEDLSAEISLTRRYRAELDLSRDILDALPDAVAIFDRVGHLTQSNAAYDALWNCQGDNSFTHFDVEDAIRSWGSASVTSPVWNEVRAQLIDDLPPKDWTTTIHLLDGRSLNLSVCGLNGGARMIRFDQLQVVTPSRLIPPGARDRIEMLLKA